MANVLLEGLPPHIALWRLLLHRGIKTTLETHGDEEGEDGENSAVEVNRLIQKLDASGLRARSIQVQVSDLVHLQMPTMLMTHTGAWILLRKRSANGWLVEHGGGVGVVPESALAESSSGIALEISEAFPDKGGLWKRLLKLLPEHRQILMMSLGASTMVQGLSIISPWLTARMIDGALAKGAGSLLQILCIGMILTALFKAWAGWLRDITLNAFSARIDMALEKGLFDHLLHLPFKHLQGKTMGELLQAFSGIKRARGLVLNRGLAAIFDACTAVVYLIYMLMLMPAVAGIVIFGAVLLSLASAIIGYLQMRVAHLQIQASQAEHSALAELLNGAPTLKATGSQNWVLARWKEKLSLELLHSLRQDRIGLWAEAISELLSQGSNICILIWGGYKVLDGELSLGQLLAFSQLSSSFVGVVTSLSQTMLSVALARPQLAQVQEAFATARQPEGPLSAPTELMGPVVVEGVWFRYEKKAPWILKGSNLRVQTGSFYHLKGTSGSGKSTLLKLLAGLYTPDIGRISIGNLDSVAANNLMVFLPQFPQLSSGSILENLRIFSGDRPKAHLFEVARETGLDEWVKTLPMGYQTSVASGGGNLSGGQRQLVAITAVLASDKQLLLLDEALSNLDWISRRCILQCPRFHGRTIIYASHEEVIPI